MGDVRPSMDGPHVRLTNRQTDEGLTAPERLVANNMEEGRLYEALRVGDDYFPVWRDPKTKRPYLRSEEDLFGNRTTMTAPSNIRQVVALNGVITEVKKPLSEVEASSPSLEERLPSTRARFGKFGAAERNVGIGLRNAGDHRVPRRTLADMVADHTTRRVVEDFEGYDERPEPLQASSAEEFLEALREYRVWAGEPSYRKMSSNCGQKVAYSTFCTALNGDRLPNLSLVQACIEACGGSHEDVQRWTTAWRRLRKQETEAPAATSADGHRTGQVFEFINHVRANGA